MSQVESDILSVRHSRCYTFNRALKASVPVFLGYIAIGIGFGLIAVNTGYPAALAISMSVIMYAGAAQYIGIGLFAAGASLPEIALVTLVVNLRHAAYGLSLIGPFARAPRLRPYLVFALTDETYALLTSVGEEDRKDGRFMFFVSILDQSYWVLGTVIGAVAGSFIPFKLDGLEFALTALFIVLTIEQMLRVRDPLPFIVSAFCAVAAAFLVGPRGSIVVAMVASVVLTAVLERKHVER
ncbi:MAG: AzlC family ABC transporter permease [Treponemataceae bacterium]